MHISVCITTFNEKPETVKKLLDALNSQTLKPDEIILIDAKDYDNCSRSKGRNIATKKARNEIIAITDAGCIPHKDWLEKITKPFKDKNVDVVAGGYEMITRNHFQKACKMFLGVSTKDMKEDFIAKQKFMPSARSLAFTKTIWKKAGGFPEKLKGAAEDTVFNLNLIKVGANFVTASNAVVDWYMPKTIGEFTTKVFNYAKGDAESGIWWHPVKKFKTHNIKILTVFARYLILFCFPLELQVLLILTYVAYAYSKAGLWGIVLQLTSDMATMSGFIAGIIGFSHGLLQSSIKRP